MTQGQSLNPPQARAKNDRRRHPTSMIENYCEYDGPERRSGRDRRTLEAALMPTSGPQPTIKRLS